MKKKIAIDSRYVSYKTVASFGRQFVFFLVPPPYLYCIIVFLELS